MREARCRDRLGSYRHLSIGSPCSRLPKAARRSVTTPIRNWPLTRARDRSVNGAPRQRTLSIIVATAQSGKKLSTLGDCRTLAASRHARHMRDNGLDAPHPTRYFKHEIIRRWRAGAREPMRIVSIGGGPAGLYFGLLMKLRHPEHSITVVERNKPYDTFGWGVVFSDAMMEAMRHADPVSAAEIADAFNHWDDIELIFKGAPAAHERARLHRHRPQASAQYPAAALRGAGRRACLRARGRVRTSSSRTRT